MLPKNMAWLLWLAFACAGCVAGPLQTNHEPIGSTPTGEAPGFVGATASGAEFAEVEGPVGLTRAAGLALERHPALDAFAYQWRAADARMLQASLRPNPEVEFELENLTGTGEFADGEALETTLAIEQLIELGGDRAARTRRARAERDLVRFEYELNRLELLSQVAQRFLQVLVARRELALAEQSAQLVEQMVQATARGVAAGELSPMEAARLEVQLASANNQARRAADAVQIAKLRLAAMWGGLDGDYSLAGDLPDPTPAPEVEPLLARLESHPQLARWVAVAAERRAAVAGARAAGVPDMSLGVGLRHERESDDVALLLRAAAPLAIFDRNQGDRLAALAELAQVRPLERAQRLRLQTQLVEAHRQLRSDYEQLLALEQDVLPAAQRAFEGVRQAMLAGEVGVLDVLQAQTTLIDSRQALAEALATYHQRRLSLLALTGEPMRSPLANQQTEGEANRPEQGESK